MQVVHDLDIIDNELKSCLYIVVLGELWLLKKSVQIICGAMFVIGFHNLQKKVIVAIMDRNVTLKGSSFTNLLHFALLESI